MSENSRVIFSRLPGSCVGLQNPYDLGDFTVGVSGKDWKLVVEPTIASFSRESVQSPAWSIFSCPPESWEQDENGGWTSQHSASRFAHDLPSSSHISSSTSSVSGKPQILAFGVWLLQRIHPWPPMKMDSHWTVLWVDLSSNSPVFIFQSGSPFVVLGAFHFWVFTGSQNTIILLFIVVLCIGSLSFPKPHLFPPSNTVSMSSFY